MMQITESEVRLLKRLRILQPGQYLVILGVSPHGLDALTILSNGKPEGIGKRHIQQAEPGQGEFSPGAQT